MRRLLQVLSWLALAATILPAMLFLAGSISLAETKLAMLIATIAWFAATPFWMDRKESVEDELVI